MKGTCCLFYLILLLFGGSCTTIKKSTPALEIKNKNPRLPLTDSFLTSLLGGHPAYFDTLLRNNEQWRIKIIYTRIDRDNRNQPSLTHHYYNINPGQYFYPASTVKLPVAALALQKLHGMGSLGIDKNTTMVTDAVAPGQTAAYNDPTSPDGRPTVAQYIKKIFLVSDNDAYNRLYEFLGQEYLNKTLHQMGYDSVQLLHRLQVSLSEEQNRTTNPVRFFDTAGRLLYAQPAISSNLRYQPRHNYMGRGYMNGGKLVAQPFNFSAKNRFSLIDLHSVLQSLIFPETVPVRQRLNLKESDYRFLYQQMSLLPRESSIPQYEKNYPDGYVKFLLFGGEGAITNPSIRIFNKVGDAYGFLQDVAYIADFENGVEFMLSASIYCNSNGIFNDDNYDYEKVGFPFLKHLGEVIYQHERQRVKKYLPDLSRFSVNTDN